MLLDFAQQVEYFISKEDFNVNNEKFKEDLKNLGKRVSKAKENIGTEEATKNSLVLPFFQILGYDIFDPVEFVPEFTADVGIKKGEKVDFAVVLEGNPVILIEAKSIHEKLTKHDSQLFRYFGTTISKFGILTNGQEYKFFTDLDEPNKMDLTPFLTIDITNLKDTQIPEIAKFHKDNFDIDKISSSASELKYLSILKEFLSKQAEEPSAHFVKFLVGEIYDGIKTKKAIDKFSPIIKKGFSQFINEKVNDKLSAALNTSVVDKEEAAITDIEEQEQVIVTTDEELEAFITTKLILKDTVPLDRISYRDNRSYFNILLDDSIRKWILRVFTSNNKLRIELNDSKKTKYELEAIFEITNYSEEIISIVENYLKNEVTSVVKT